MRKYVVLVDTLAGQAALRSRTLVPPEEATVYDTEFGAMAAACRYAAKCYDRKLNPPPMRVEPLEDS